MVKFMRIKYSTLIQCVLKSVFKLLPVKKDTILLGSFVDFSDNTKVFFDYLMKNGLNSKYRIVWTVKEPKIYCKRKNVKFISSKTYSPSYCYYLCRSNILLHSHYFFSTARKKQIVINTTHSICAIKAYADINTNKDHYMLCNSDYCKTIRKKHCNLDDSHFIVTGLPRIDLLDEDRTVINCFFPEFADKKIIVSMETFKQGYHYMDSDSVDEYALNVIDSLEEMKQLNFFLEENNAVLLIKLHKNQDTSKIKQVAFSSIHYIESGVLEQKGFQANHLLNVADILLTDYSSVFFDYLLLNHPIGFMIADMKEYRRGFEADNPLEHLPGKIIQTFVDLLEFLKSSFEGKDDFQIKRLEDRKKYFQYLDNNNCERLLNWIVEKQKEV